MMDQLSFIKTTIIRKPSFLSAKQFQMKGKSNFNKFITIVIIPLIATELGMRSNIKKGKTKNKNTKRGQTKTISY